MFKTSSSLNSMLESNTEDVVFSDAGAIHKGPDSSSGALRPMHHASGLAPPPFFSFLFITFQPRVE